MGRDNELSEREIEIVRLVATGAANKEIALRLNISANTVKVHLRNIFAKMGAASRTELALLALQQGLVESVPPAIPSALPERRRLPIWLLVMAGVLLAAGLGGLVWSIRAGVWSSGTGTTGSETAPRWRNLASLPEGLRFPAATPFEGGIYLFGGHDALGVSAKSWHYVPGEDRWEQLADKPAPVQNAQAAVLGDQIYIPGGLAADGAPSDLLEVYDPRLDLWHTAARLPAPRSNYALAAYDGRLYLFGGWDGRQFVADVFSYDPTKDAWSRMASAPAALGDGAAVSLGSKIEWMGGRNQQGISAGHWAYYPDRDLRGEPAWEELAPLPAGRYGISATALSGQVYLAGGWDENGLVSQNILLVYSPRANAWSAVPGLPGGMGVGSILVALDSDLHFLGGQSGLTPQSRHLAYQAVYTIMLPIIP